MKQVILGLLIGAAFTQAAQAQEAPREKVGLVLSGGGARGLAHLGVLKALEEQHIPIDYIAGTSAGALIGGMYASGLSVKQIEEQINKMDLTSVAFAPADRRETTQNVRNLDYQANSIVDVSVTKGGKVALPNAVSSGVKVEETLRDLLKNQPYDTDFEKLPIPFNAVAADITTGKMVVLKKGQLAHALRASMSIPAVFSPVEMDGKLLVDGMIDRNLPVDVVRKMGATRVIAVDVGSDLLKKEDLGSVIAVSEQMLGLLVKRNVDEQVASLTAKDVLIRPSLGNIGNLQFDKGSAASQLGYQYVHSPSVQNQLKSFALNPQTYASSMSKHVLPEQKAVKIDYVRIETHGLARPANLMHELMMKDGQLFDLDTVNQDIARLLSSGRISNVKYHVNAVGDKTELVYEVFERDESHNSVRAGVEVASNSLSDQQFGLHILHRSIWVNSLGGEWRNHVSIGKKTLFETQINQPLNNSGSVFIRPSASFGYEKRPAYLEGSSQISTEYTTRRARLGFLVGSPIKRIGEWGLGLSYDYAQLKGNSNNPVLTINDARQKNLTADAQITLDQLDDPFIPTKGYFLNAYAQVGLNKQDNDKRYFNTGMRGLYALSHNAHSLAFAAELGGANSDKSVYLSPYSLGGYHHLSGYAHNQLIGNYLAYTSLTYRYRTDYSILNNPLIFGTSLEAGNVWQNAGDISADKTKFSGSIFGALRTPIGPAQLGVGLTRTGKTSYYFFLGRTFSGGQ